MVGVSYGRFSALTDRFGLHKLSFTVHGLPHDTLIYFEVLRLFYVLRTLCLHVCPCTTLMPGTRRGQKRVSDTRKLEVQMVVSYCVGARNQTRDLWKNIQCSQLLSYFPSSLSVFTSYLLNSWSSCSHYQVSGIPWSPSSGYHAQT